MWLKEHFVLTCKNHFWFNFEVHYELLYTWKRAKLFISTYNVDPFLPLELVSLNYQCSLTIILEHVGSYLKAQFL